MTWPIYIHRVFQSWPNSECKSFYTELKFIRAVLLPSPQIQYAYIGRDFPRLCCWYALLASWTSLFRGPHQHISTICLQSASTQAFFAFGDDVGKSASATHPWRCTTWERPRRLRRQSQTSKGYWNGILHFSGELHIIRLAVLFLLLYWVSCQSGPWIID